jgi:hypothetical protein
VEFRTGATYTVRELGEASLGIRQKLADASWFQGAQVAARVNAVMAYMVPASMDESPEQVAAALSAEFGVRVIAYVDEPQEHDVVTPEQARRRDAESYAAAEGIPVEETMRRLELQAAAGEFGHELELAAADRYAGHWSQHQPDYRLVLWLAGDEPVPAELMAMADSGPIPVTTMVGADYAYSELRSAQERLPTVIGEEVANGLDLKENAVSVYLFRAVTDAEIEALAASLPAQLGVRVLVEQTERPTPD